MASNGTSQSYLYNTRGAVSDGNSTRNRSMEQQQGYSGNPNLPMFNNSYNYGAGGQQYGYSRYQPPMMTGFNNQQWVGQGNPYSYNTPNSYGSNYGGGNFYTPYQSSPYQGPFQGSQFGQGQQNPNLPMFGRPQQNQFQGNYGFSGPGQSYQTDSPYGGRKPLQEGGQLGSQESYYKPGMQSQFMPNWAMDPYRGNSGTRYGRQPSNPDMQSMAAQASANSEQLYPQPFQQFLNMGY